MKRRSLVSLATAVLTAIALVLVGPTAAQAKPAKPTKSIGYTQVVVDPAVYALIGSAGITPAPIDGAKAFAYQGTLAARFPISGYALNNLRIKHTGGISLTAGAATISLSKFNIDLARTAVSGEVAGTIGSVGRVDLFRVKFSDKPRLGLVKLTLTDTAAGALNATFGVSAFSGGDTFGYATPRPFARF